MAPIKLCEQGANFLSVHKKTHTISMLSFYLSMFIFSVCGCLPENKWLFLFFCHVPEAGEHEQQILLKFSRCSGHYHIPQKVWIIVVHRLIAVFIWLLLYDPIGVDNKFNKSWVKCCFIAKMVQLHHEVIMSLNEMQLIVLIYFPCQRVCANLQERRQDSNGLQRTLLFSK